MSSRTVELILGIVGGIFGLLGAVAVIAIGGLGGTVYMPGASETIGLGFLAVMASIIGIVGAAFVKSKTKISGIMMIVAAIIGIVSVSLFYILGTIFFGIAGILALVKKE